MNHVDVNVQYTKNQKPQQTEQDPIAPQKAKAENFRCASCKSLCIPLMVRHLLGVVSSVHCYTSTDAGGSATVPKSC